MKSKKEKDIHSTITIYVQINSIPNLLRYLPTHCYCLKKGKSNLTAKITTGNSFILGGVIKRLIARDNENEMRTDCTLQIRTLVLRDSLRLCDTYLTCQIPIRNN